MIHGCTSAASNMKPDAPGGVSPLPIYEGIFCNGTKAASGVGELPELWNPNFIRRFGLSCSGGTVLGSEEVKPHRLPHPPVFAVSSSPKAPGGVAVTPGTFSLHFAGAVHKRRVMRLTWGTRLSSLFLRVHAAPGALRGGKPRFFFLPHVSMLVRTS